MTSIPSAWFDYRIPHTPEPARPWQSAHDADIQTVSDPATSAVMPSGLLPAFNSRHYSHLLTPQSPRSRGHHLADRPGAPESPLTNAFLLSEPFPSNFPSSHQPHASVDSQQIATPDPSPYLQRIANVPQSRQASIDPDRIAVTSSSRAASPRLTLAPAHQITPPVPSPSRTPPRSRLSSPFPDNLRQVAQRSFRPQPSQLTSSSMAVDDVFTASAVAAPIATPPRSPPSVSFPTETGGEMNRIRLQMLEQQTTLHEEAESRRPDYLKRAKRARPDSERVDNGESEDRIGIAMSPVKGRRLMLFQETSEESFEESLMAGGYGRYRTLDWNLEKPMPVPSDFSNVLPPQFAEGNLNLKDAKKRRRLEAFLDPEKFSTSAKLCPTEIEGKGRILLDVSGDQAFAFALKPTCKRGSRRKRKATAQDPIHNSKGLRIDARKGNAGPNWPDSEFPWRLRMEERVELARAEQDEKMRWIEKFLDRDTEDEDDEKEEFVLSRSQNIRSAAPPRGRRYSKDTVTAEPGEGAFSPTDTADARAMLRAQRSVVAWMKRRQLAQKNNEEEVLCICGGREEGREQVQCDECMKWYHLQCLGITSISELGDEEDPWYCPECYNRTPTPELVSSSFEPTFVPTYNEPFRGTPSDLPFFQGPFQDSPMTLWPSVRPPQTPLRGSEAGSNFSPSKLGSYTPQHRDNRAMYESAFDPASTPMRSFKFPGASTTPKSSLWGSRTPIAFHAPSRRRGSHGSAPYEDNGGYGPSSASYRGTPSHPGTPTPRAPRQQKTGSSKRTLNSPTGSRPSLTGSPVVSAKERSDGARSSLE